MIRIRRRGSAGERAVRVADARAAERPGAAGGAEAAARPSSGPAAGSGIRVRGWRRAGIGCVMAEQGRARETFGCGSGAGVAANPAAACNGLRASISSITDIHRGSYRKPAMRRRCLLLSSLALPLASAARARAAVANAADAAVPLTVFAAASLTEALREMARLWQGRGHPAPRLSFAASSALARQIEQGAGADLFLSADEPWMNHLQQRQLIVDASRVSPIGNRLVLIAPADLPRRITLARGVDLAAELGPRGRMATGDPAHVPAGRYARAALEWLGQWDALGPRLARADNVRAALLLVERGEAPLGIVYATDAAASRRVAVLGEFPAESHPPITYPFAITRRAQANAQARAFHGFLGAAAARATWQRFGFSLRG
jgi:molybdate transport system substrate-binding protein